MEFGRGIWGIWTGAMFSLMLAFILLFTVSYTLDYRYGLATVHLLTGCRVALLVAAAGYLWGVRHDFARLVDPFVLALIAVAAIGTVSGLFRAGDWQTYLRHGFQYTFLLAFYLVGRSLGGGTLSPRIIPAVTVTVLVGYVIATALYFETSGLHSGSYSYQPNLVLLPLASAVSGGNWAIALVSAAIVVVGNKRAVFLGACTIVALLITIAIEHRKGWKSVKRRVVMVVALTSIITVASATALSGIARLGVPLITVGDRFSLAPTYTFSHVRDERPIQSADSPAPARQADRPVPMSKQDVDKLESEVNPMVRFSSARNVEVESVWHLLRDTPAALLVGYGFGAEFVVRYVSPYDYKPVEFTRNQADVLPVHIAMTSGIPLAVLFTAILLGFLWRLFARLREVHGTDLVVVIFVLGLSADTMLGFNATNPLIWSALGFCSMRVLRAAPLSPGATAPSAGDMSCDCSRVTV
jgi:hypothetical protein